MVSLRHNHSIQAAGTSLGFLVTCRVPLRGLRGHSCHGQSTLGTAFQSPASLCSWTGSCFCLLFLFKLLSSQSGIDYWGIFLYWPEKKNALMAESAPEKKRSCIPMLMRVEFIICLWDRQSRVTFLQSILSLCRCHGHADSSFQMIFNYSPKATSFSHLNTSVSRRHAEHRVQVTGAAVCGSASLGGYFLARWLSLTFPLSRTEISLSGALCSSKPWDRVGTSCVSACLPQPCPLQALLPRSYISFSKVQLTSPPTSAQDPQWVSVPKSSPASLKASKILAISPLPSVSLFVCSPTRQSCQLLGVRTVSYSLWIHWIGTQLIN